VDVAGLVLQFVMLILAISIHESAHAWTADRFGDPTARMLGRVSLNPLAHVDIFGTILFPILLALFHQPIFGWAKPVPVNPLNLRNPRIDGAVISAAGPASNLGLALIFTVAFHLVVRSGMEMGSARGIVLLCWYGVVINVLLAVFNLIPIPPLDGGGILSGFLPPAALAVFEKIQPYGFLILIVLLYLGVINFIIRFVQGPILALLGIPH
jgi:Zn-dependent protease